jgi:MFS family permease
MKILATGFVLLFLGGFGLAASWEAFGLQVLTGTALGYLGGFIGAQTGAYLAQAFGWGLIDGVLGPILAAYVGYAFGSTLAAWAGITWSGFYLRIEGDPWFGLLGASAGTALAFLFAFFTDWEWALRLGPPLASLGGALLFTIAPKVEPSPRSD